MRRLTLLVLVLLPSTVIAAPSPRVTYFGETLLSRCDVVVRARVVSRAVLSGGMTLTTFRVEEVLQGLHPEKRLVLGSPDPGYHGESGREYVLFLARAPEPGRRLHRTLERFPSDEKRGRARLAMTRAYIRCERIEEEVRRVTETRELHVRNVVGDDAWARANAIRELSWFTRHWADTFSAAERDRLFAVREQLRDQALLDMLSRALHRIDEARPSRSEPEPRPSRSGREAAYRVAIEQVRRTASGPVRARRLRALASKRPARIRADLVAFLEDGAPEVRRAAAYTLGETEHAPAASVLLEVLGREREDDDVRRLAVRALGILRHEPAVSAIAQELSRTRPGCAEAAILALARIGSEKAKQALAACRERMAAGGEREAALRRTLDFVASDGFARQESILARVRQSRLAKDR